MKRSLRALFLLVVSGLGVGCASSGTKPALPGGTRALVETPQRTYERIDNAGKSLGDFFEVGKLANPVHTDRKTAILSAAYFIAELGLDARLSVEEQAGLAHVLLADLPTGDATKEVVLPHFSSGDAGSSKDGEVTETDLYLFVTDAGDGSGKPAYKLQTNLPLSSNYSPGIYDGYEVNLKGRLFVGQVPKAWVSTFYFYKTGAKLSYWGPSLPRVGSPLVVKGDGIGSDRLLSITLADKMDVEKAITEIHSVVASVSETIKTETNENKLTSALRLKKMGTLSESLYNWIAGNLTDANALLEEARAVDVGAPKVTRFDNSSRLTAVLGIAYSIDAHIKEW